MEVAASKCPAGIAPSTATQACSKDTKRKTACLATLNVFFLKSLKIAPQAGESSVHWL